MKYIFYCFILFSFLNISKAENTEIQKKKIEYIRLIADNIFEIAKKKISDKQKILEISNLIKKEADFEWNARMAIGQHGRSFSKEDFNKFISLYSNVLCKNWSNKLSIAEIAKKEDITFSERIIKMNETDDLIGFFLETRNGNKFNVKIVVKTIDEKNAVFKILDIVGEGISVAVSYRNQFSAFIDENGIDKLIPHLESILKKDK